jgi:hypothetical protein
MWVTMPTREWCGWLDSGVHAVPVSVQGRTSREVNWVQIDLEKDDHDHLISPEERFKVAMARQ